MKSSLTLQSLAAPQKLQGSSALPVPPTGRRRRIRATSKAPPVWQVIALSLANVALGIALQGGIELLLTTQLRSKSALKVVTTLPLPWAIARDLLKCFALREALQYYLHRFILHPNRPTRLSELHAKYGHSVTAPFSFFTHYDSPLTYIIWRWIPVYLPAMLFRLHLLTYFLFLTLVTLEETTSFSGYVSIPTILLGGLTRRQDLHLESQGGGNYGAWGVLDWIHGTTLGTGLDEDVQDEWEKHNGTERTKSAVRVVSDAAYDTGSKAMRNVRKRRDRMNN
jgi:hypothetical protein